jgi:hypothetical protein
MKNFGYLAAVSVAVIAQAASAQPAIVAAQSTTATISQISTAPAEMKLVKMSDGKSFYVSPSKSRVTISGAVSKVTSLAVGMNCTYSYTTSYGNVMPSMAC